MTADSTRAHAHTRRQRRRSTNTDETTKNVAIKTCTVCTSHFHTCHRAPENTPRALDDQDGKGESRSEGEGVGRQPQRSPNEPPNDERQSERQEKRCANAHAGTRGHRGATRATGPLNHGRRTFRVRPLKVRKSDVGHTGRHQARIPAIEASLLIRQTRMADGEKDRPRQGKTGRKGPTTPKRRPHGPTRRGGGAQRQPTRLRANGEGGRTTNDQRHASRRRSEGPPATGADMAAPSHGEDPEDHRRILHHDEPIQERPGF